MTAGLQSQQFEITLTGESIEDVDLWCAAKATGVVLITGSGAPAHAVAVEIHRRHSAEAQPFCSVDCDDPDFLRALTKPGGGTLFLRHVDRLSPALQEQLFTHLTQPAALRRRVVAWSERCPDKSLDPGLFYRLNTVHIALSSKSRGLALQLRQPDSPCLGTQPE